MQIKEVNQGLDYKSPIINIQSVDPIGALNHLQILSYTILIFWWLDR